MEITCPVSHSEVVLVVAEYYNCSATFLCFRQTDNTLANEWIVRNNVIDAFKWQRRRGGRSEAQCGRGRAHYPHHCSIKFSSDCREVLLTLRPNSVDRIISQLALSLIVIERVDCWFTIFYIRQLTDWPSDCNREQSNYGPKTRKPFSFKFYARGH